MIDNDFTKGFMAGYWGKQCPEDASSDFIKGYERGYATSERESAMTGVTV